MKKKKRTTINKNFGDIEIRWVSWKDIKNLGCKPTKKKMEVKL